MPSTFLRRSVASAAATALAIPRPGVLEDENPLQAGDLLVACVGVCNRSGESATLTLPANWFALAITHIDGSSRTRLFFAFHYVVEPIEEPSTYSFGYTASRDLVGVILAYRGVQRDMTDLITHPYGDFAPNSVQFVTGAGTAQTASVLAGIPGSAFSRVLRVLIASHATDEVLFDDPNPLTTIRGYLRSPVGAMLVLDTETTDQPAAVSVRSNKTVEYLYVNVILEPLIPLASNYDTYSSKILRTFMGPPYDTSLTTPLGRLLAVIGALDNDISGVSGADDFLPDDAGGQT